MQGCGGWGRLVKVGGGDRVAPRSDDRVGDLLKSHGPAECSSERGYPICNLWLAAYGCNDLLRAVEQNGPMLQECVSFPDLRRAHQLATGDEYLAAYRGREARRRLVDPRGWWRLVGGHRGIGTEGELAGACRLNQRRAHRPPLAGTRTPGSDRRTRRPRGSPTATPCATASTPRGRRRARAHTADPTCRRRRLPGCAARS